MPLPSLARLALPTAQPFGPIEAEPFDEKGDADAFPNGGIKYTIDLPDEWNIRPLPGPLRVVGRGSLATAVEAIRRPSDKVVVLVRPLGAHLPHEDDCPATRWSKDPNGDDEDTRWMQDCLVLSRKEYEKEIEGILDLMSKLGDAKLLPTLYDNGIVTGSTESAPWPQFEAREFGVQVWQQMTTTIAGYIKTNRTTRKQFIDNLMPKIQESCEKLAQLEMYHYDLHLDNVAVDIAENGEMSDVVFLDPASIREEKGPRYRQCDSQDLVREFDMVDWY